MQNRADKRYIQLTKGIKINLTNFTLGFLTPHAANSIMNDGNKACVDAEEWFVKSISSSCDV